MRSKERATRYYFSPHASPTMQQRLLFCLVALLTATSAFVVVPSTTRNSEGAFLISRLAAAPLPSPEESAEALRAYMVKSGERVAGYEKEIQVIFSCVVI